MYYTSDDKVIVEDDDQCYTCKYMVDKNKPCPLLEAIYCGAVFFEESLNVYNCSSYEKLERKLKIVK